MSPISGPGGSVPLAAPPVLPPLPAGVARGGLVTPPGATQPGVSQPGAAKLGAAKLGGAQNAGDARLHKVAKDFEAVFLSEMLRLTRPPDKAASGFSAGESGDTWQVFMDQALGEAAAKNGGTGLTKQIEAALKRAQAGSQKGSHP